jgi:hypothetical protein
VKDEPRSGPCSPWVQGSAIERLPWIRDAAAELTKKERLEAQALLEICGEAAMAASDVLYELSGRIFTGECGPVTIRPQARPADMDTRAWAGLGSSGWGGNGGLGSSYGGQLPGVVTHYGKVSPPEVDLGVHPVTEIVQVKIDGEVIPSDEYELRDHRRLVRLRTSASAQPVARFGWPTSQIPDLPDTEPGTFSVTFKFGQRPPRMGVDAATRLAEYLALPRLGDRKHYPQRVTSMSRQGVSATVVDVMDVLKARATGIYEVDLFLLTYNPTRHQRQPRVFSPDRGRPRRTATPSA